MSLNAHIRSNVEAALIRQAWADPTFKDKLVKDPGAFYRAEMAQAGSALPPNTEVRFLEETGKDLYLLIPHEIDLKTEVKLNERSTRAEFEAALILHARRDPAFLQTLRRNPKAAYQQQLTAVRPEAKLPDDMTIRVVEESDHLRYFRLPQAPAQSGELSEVELEAVAGGVAVVGIAVGVVLLEEAADQV